MLDRHIPDLSTVQSPPRRNLEYEILSQGDHVDSGGQAVVSRVELSDARPPAAVAVKEPLQPSATLENQAVEAFLEEARIWRRLDTIEREKPLFENSEHIVGIVDVGSRLPWVALEYMDGGSLADRLVANPDGLPVSEALWIGECICRGVKLAHDRGVAHLDLKPANVLFRTSDGEMWDVPKIGDWGLSRVLLDESGSMDAISVEYAAPEQFDIDQFGEPDQYTDIYQVGALVYTMLTGDPPYTGGQASVMHEVVYGDRQPTPGTGCPAVPESVDRAVQAALSREKADRHHGEIQRFADALRDARRETNASPSKAAETETEPRTNYTESVTPERNTTASSTEIAEKVSNTEPRADRSQSQQMWRTFRADASRSGYAPETSAPRRDVHDAWKFKTGGNVESSPAVVGDTVYIGSNDGNIYALNATDGNQQWTFHTDGAVRSSPVVTDDSVYVGSDDGHLYALDCDSGQKRWSAKLVDHHGGSYRIDSSPVVSDGTVYVGSRSWCVYAVDTANGDQKWRVGNLRPVYSSPAVVDGDVYVGAKNHQIQALDGRDGQQLWTFETDEPVYSSPAVVDGTVYVGSNDGHLYALDAADGTEHWSYQTGEKIRSSPAVSGDSVYVGCDDDTVYGLNATTGDERWSVSADGRVRSSPAVAASTVYVGDDSGTVHALDAGNGTQRWTFETINAVSSSPAVADGTIYVGSKDGYVYALTEG
jgi:outer membrane protein assembly factor BamB